MSVPLESLATCFQGLLPAQLFTCSRDGIPNAAYLSHVDYVDAVARRAVVPVLQQEPAEHRREPARARERARSGHGSGLAAPPASTSDRRPRARSSSAWLCGSRRSRRTAGSRASSSCARRTCTRCSRLMPCPKSRAVSQHERIGAHASEPHAVFTMKAMQDLAERIHRADCLEGLVDSILEGLDDAFGFKHSMILVPTDEDGVLVTIGSRGYAENGVGAEVRFGEGHRRHGGGSPQAHSHLGADARHALRARHAPGSRRTPAFRRACAFRCRDWRTPRASSAFRSSCAASSSAVLCLESEVPIPFSRRGQSVNRTAGQLPRDRHPEHAAAGAHGRRAGQGGVRCDA